MTFKLEINCDNAAFDDLGSEVSRILSRVADDVSSGATEGNLRDFNGNRVGSFKFTGKRKE